MSVIRDDTYILVLTHMQNFGKSILQRYAISELSKKNKRTLLLTETYEKLQSIVIKMEEEFNLIEGIDFFVLYGVEKICEKYAELVENKKVDTINDYELQKVLDNNRTHDAHLQILHNGNKEDFENCSYSLQRKTIKGNRKPIFCVNAMFIAVGQQFGGIEKIFVDESSGFFNLHQQKWPSELVEALETVEFKEISVKIENWPDFRYILNYGGLPEDDKNRLIHEMEDKIRVLLREGEDGEETRYKIERFKAIIETLQENLFIKRSGSYYTLPTYYYILMRASEYDDKPQIITSSALARDNPLFQAQIFSYSDLLSDHGFPLYTSATISFLKEETPEELKSIRPYYFQSIDTLPTEFRKSFGSNKLRELFVKKYIKEKKISVPLKEWEISENAGILWRHLYKEAFKKLGFPNNANVKIWAITFTDVGKSLKKVFPKWKYKNFSGKTQGLDPEDTDKMVLILGDLTNKETITSFESIYYKDKPISNWFTTSDDGFSIKEDNKEVKEFVWTVIIRESIEYLMRGRGKIPVIHLGKMYHGKDNQEIVEKVFNEMKIELVNPRAATCPKCGVKNIVLQKSATKKCEKCKSTIWVGKAQ